ncbi:MAG: hypothetical protein CMJ22_04720 [Phycisphaerae bacterium]|nr:hypothetical protein [Phycisphaerae bacterium]
MDRPGATEQQIGRRNKIDPMVGDPQRVVVGRRTSTSGLGTVRAITPSRRKSPLDPSSAA